MSVSGLFFFVFTVNMVSGTCEATDYVVTGVEGHSITIVCQYSENRQLCRPPDSRIHCNVDDLLIIAGQNKITKQGRYTLNCGGDQQPFNVTITNLSAQDAGTYLCGSSVVRLKIQKPHGQPTVFYVTMAAVVVAAVGTAVLFVSFRYRRNKRPDMRHTKTHADQLDQPDCTYEEIVDTNGSTTRTANAGPDCVDSTPQLPKIPYADSTYSLASLPTIPSDASAELPTIPSDDHTYATAELSTTASHDLTYTLV